MKIDFTKRSKVIYTQYDYINEIMSSVSTQNNIQGESPTPASGHHFQSDDHNIESLFTQEQADLFHQ